MVGWFGERREGRLQSTAKSQEEKQCLERMKKDK